MKSQVRIENIFLIAICAGILAPVYGDEAALLKVLSIVTAFLSLWFFIPVNAAGLKKPVVYIHSFVFALLAGCMYATGVVWIFACVVAYAIWIQYALFKKDSHFFETGYTLVLIVTVYMVMYPLFPLDIKDFLYAGFVVSILTMLFYIINRQFFQKKR